MPLPRPRRRTPPEQRGQAGSRGPLRLGWAWASLGGAELPRSSGRQQPGPSAGKPAAAGPAAAVLSTCGASREQLRTAGLDPGVCFAATLASPQTTASPLHKARALGPWSAKHRADSSSGSTSTALIGAVKPAKFRSSDPHKARPSTGGTRPVPGHAEDRTSTFQGANRGTIVSNEHSSWFQLILSKRAPGLKREEIASSAC